MNFHRSRLAIISLFLVLGFTALSCSSGVNLYSKQQDLQLGQQMQAEIAKDPAHYPILNNPALRNYVQSIVNRIIQSPNVTNKDFNYTVTIIHDDKTVNAFTLPGGPIYVYTGLMKYVDNEATLAGILAHEITHADHRHSTQQMTKQYGLERVTQMALGQDSGLVAQIGETLAMLQFSQADEREADANSFTDLYQLSGRPWYPAAIKYFMIKTLNTGGSQPPPELTRLFSTHPPSQDRLNATVAQAKAANLPEPSEAQLNTAGYQRYRSMLP
ncbi:MAG: M48 family metalloprotease [Bacteroidota bacterium]|nr:M48 family metalloprotease [Bacteroidota bacterium]MDP4228967.1 M48 family metalloprotease [Bacteroidota bacterium]MDP4237606.1 M48 family metalloprotease [Bacteroidota bacterium]